MSDWQPIDLELGSRRLPRPRHEATWSRRPLALVRDPGRDRTTPPQPARGARLRARICEGSGTSSEDG